MKTKKGILKARHSSSDLSGKLICGTYYTHMDLLLLAHMHLTTHCFFLFSHESLLCPLFLLGVSEREKGSKNACPIYSLGKLSIPFFSLIQMFSLFAFLFPRLSLLISGQHVKAYCTLYILYIAHYTFSLFCRLKTFLTVYGLFLPSRLLHFRACMDPINR